MNRCIVVAVACWAVAASGCHEPRDVWSGHETGPSSVESESEARGDAESLVEARAWIDAMVDRAVEGPPFMWEANEYEPCSARLLARAKYYVGVPANLGAGTFHCDIRRLDVDTIMRFIDVGPAIIPDLMPHIRDERPTGWTFQPLVSSAGAASRRPESVGKVACYLIEAVLRENPCFASGSRFMYESPVDCDKATAKRDALGMAADAYEAWYLECFDEQSCMLACPPGKLPDVAWDYNLDWWPRRGVKWWPQYDRKPRWK